MFLYDEDRKVVIGPITQQNWIKFHDTRLGNPSIHVASLNANKVIVELYEPKHEHTLLEVSEILISSTSYPYGLQQKLSKKIPTISIFKEEYILKDLATVPQHLRSTVHESNFTKKLTINFLEEGHWTKLPNGSRVCQLKLTSFMARDFAVTGTAKIPSGAKLFIYTPTKAAIVNLHNRVEAKDKFSSNWMPGNECIIEYYEPSQVKVEGTVYLDKFTHAISKESVLLSEQKN